MRSRRTSDHQEAVARRLALLSAELAQEAPPPEPVGYAMEESHTRVAARAATTAAAPPADQAPPADPGPAPIPVPGRHASRRVVPATLRGRIALGPPQLAVVAVLVAVGLGVTAWWVVRAEAHDVVAAPVTARPAPALASSVPATPTASGVEPATGSAGSTAGEPTGEVTVDVAGKVRRPGIAVLPAGSRVVDALEAAGGARPGVDLSSLNLARVLVDGEQVLVGLPPPVGAVGSVGAAPPAGVPSGALVNLNTATQAELETLPDVGPVTAEAILAWRSEHGGFSSVDELLEVDGIGDATLATIAPHVTV